MTTIAKTKRYIGCKSVRSIIARISDKAINTRTLLRGPTVTGSGGTGRPFCKASICRSCSSFCPT